MATSTSQELHIARNLSMPRDAITRTFGVVGQRGTGKTSTAVVIVEEIAPHAPFVVIDPTGAWYGLRTSKDGKRAGLDVVVLGGHNGEIPLEEGEKSGQMVADLVIRDRYSLVLDLELMRKGKQVQFVAAFLEALYHGSREATHVVIDEAQRFAPQNTRGIGGDVPRALGAMEDVVKLGRRKGLGATVISQRAASINKEVLEQTETLIVHRLFGPNDRKAIAAWFEAQGEPEDEKEALASLPKLKRGEAFVMSPSFLEVFERFKIRRKRTFDSSVEPGIGEKVTTPKGRADVDLEALRDRMAATIERAKAEDPKELRKQLAEARRELKKKEAELEKRPTEAVEVEVEKVVEVPVLANGVREDLGRYAETIDSAAEGMREAAGAVRDELRKVTDASARKRADRTREPLVRRPAGRRQAARGSEPPPRDPAPEAGADDEVQLVGPAPAKMLEVLAQRHPTRLSISQLCTLAGYKQPKRSSTTRGALSVLRKAGYVEEAGRDIWLSEAGIDAAGDVPPPPAPDEILDHWRSVLTPPARALLDVLLEAGDWVDRDEAAVAAGYEVPNQSSTTRGAFATLRRNGLLEDGPGTEVKASDDLMEGAHG